MRKNWSNSNSNSIYLKSKQYASDKNTSTLDQWKKWGWQIVGILGGNTFALP